MRKAAKPGADEQSSGDMQNEEYDFRGGIRGKYVHRLAAGPIQRDMVPEHAREMWDTEFAKYGELSSRPEK